MFAEARVEIMFAVARVEILLAITRMDRVELSSTNTPNAELRTMRTFTTMTTLCKAEVKMKIVITRGVWLMVNNVLLTITRGTFAESMRFSASNRALFEAKSFVYLSSEDCSLVSTVKIDVLDLIVLTKFNISAWNINSSDVAVTVSVTDTVTMAVAVLSVVRSMSILVVLVMDDV